jgi:mono/diheme cytochrome c family protein
MVTGGRLRGLAAVVAIGAAVPAVALAHVAQTAPPKLVGNPVAGKQLFISTCGLCHKLRDGKTAGTVGPDLDKVTLTQAVIIKAITYGGSSVMTKRQAAKYPTEMLAYNNVLSKKQIQDISAYVFKATHPTAVTTSRDVSQGVTTRTK